MTNKLTAIILSLSAWCLPTHAAIVTVKTGVADGVPYPYTQSITATNGSFDLIMDAKLLVGSTNGVLTTGSTSLYVSTAIAGTIGIKKSNTTTSVTDINQINSDEILNMTLANLTGSTVDFVRVNGSGGAATYFPAGRELYLYKNNVLERTIICNGINNGYVINPAIQANAGDTISFGHNGSNGVRLAGFEVTLPDLDQSIYPTLPSVLTTTGGQKVTDITTWENVRRTEILGIFTDEVYGRSPAAGSYTSGSSVVSTTSIANGTAIRKVIFISVTGPNGTHSFQVPLYIPNTPSKAPVFVLINHRTDITGTSSTSEYFPLDNIILPRGYAVAVINVSGVAIDDRNTYDDGLIGKFNLSGINDWKCISAWSFAASRMIDYLVTDPAIDATKIATIGHSRSGKASIWTGAQDQRVALTCVNNAGCTGDRLLIGSASNAETIEAINRIFPHWFATKWRDYNNLETSLPFDFHMLVSLIAPRRIAQGTASGDGGADPTRQFHSLVFAQPVFSLYGATEKTWQVTDAPSRLSSSVIKNGNMQSHMRLGSHDMMIYDWSNYIDFFDLIPSLGGVPTWTKPIAVENGLVRLEWVNGTLQVADDLAGPWTDVVGAVSPYNHVYNGNRQFFRVKK